jgi:hypothetical protein
MNFELCGAAYSAVVEFHTAAFRFCVICYKSSASRFIVARAYNQLLNPHVSI